MKHNNLLETEYKEQYNQYRWIGQMQLAVLTFYGIVTTIAIAAVASFRPQGPNPIDYRWPAVIMIILGSLGLFIGYGLFRSRTMQRRTALYLKTLLIQMLDAADDAKDLEYSALRFRNLCSTKGRFKMWDTINIVILIALYSGEALLITGILAFLVVGNILSLFCAFLIGFCGLLILLCFTPWLVQKYLMDKETEKIKEEYNEAKRIKISKLSEYFKLDEQNK